MLILYFILFLFLTPKQSWAIDAFENSGNLIINHPSESHVYRLPEEMKKSSAYELVIYPHQQDSLSGLQNHKDGQDVQVLIYQANAAYHQGNYRQALDYLFPAYELEPQNTRVNNMMGSLFYLLKDFEMARKYWSESLTIQGNQQEIKQYLAKLPTM